ncbi:MAG: ABC transporter ATP-binding protein [Acidimicrobiales bacterium]
MAMEVFFRALTLVSGLAQALIYGLGGYLALTGRLDAGTVVTLALLLNRLYGPLTALASARLDVVAALVSFERVFEVLDLEPLVAETARPTAIPDGPVAVELDEVRFTYPAADKVSLASLEEVARLDERVPEQVLHGVSLRIEAGTMVALVGSSGAGKSTLASLVPRLYDVDAGAVRIGGVDVRDVSFEDLRATVGVVTQDGHLFHDTIGANLRYARPDATEDELWAALRSASLDGLVAALPDGLDTVVGERGYRLSGGERQRLTIARLLLARPRVVILDEATAHLDSSSEAAVRRAHRRPGRSHLVGHRPPVVHGAARRCHRRARGRLGGGARFPRGAAGPRRALRAAVPHPVRRPARRVEPTRRTGLRPGLSRRTCRGRPATRPRSTANARGHRAAAGVRAPPTPSCGRRP